MAHSHLHLKYFEAELVLAPLEVQAQPQLILNPDYHPRYFSVFYDFEVTGRCLLILNNDNPANILPQ